MLEVPVMAAIGGLLSALVLIASALVRTSYARVEMTLIKVEATLHSLEEHKTVHCEWRKAVDRRLSVMEKRVFGHAREDNTPPAAG